MAGIDWREQRDASIVRATRLLGARLRPLLSGEADAAARVVHRLRAAQVQTGAWGIVRLGLAAVARRLWEATTDVIVSGYAAQAQLANQQMRRVVRDISAAGIVLAEPELLTPADAIDFARQHAALTRHGVTLAQRVYRNRLANVARARALVDQGIRQSWTVERLAGQVHDLIDPRTPGGASYAAFRLAQTELTGAWYERTLDEFKRSEWIELAYYRLSRTHRVPDACDALATDGPYPLASFPAKPHPLCHCWAEPSVDASLAIAARVHVLTQAVGGRRVG